MTHQATPGRFEAIDPKLNVFALANGMDLIKSESARRLTWYMDGRERGLRVEPLRAGGYAVTALAWETTAPEDATTASVAEAVELTELAATLDAAIARANAL